MENQFIDKVIDNFPIILGWIIYVGSILICLEWVIKRKMDFTIKNVILLSCPILNTLLSIFIMIEDE